MEGEQTSIDDRIDQLREESPEPTGIDIPGIYGYLRYKAARYLVVGPVEYRQDDYFHFPPEDWDADRLATLANGCRQIVRWRGISPECPFEELGIEGFGDLLGVCHFKLRKQAASFGSSGKILDQMDMIHVVTKDEITLFNLV